MAYVPPHSRLGTKLTQPSAVMPPEEPQQPPARPESRRRPRTFLVLLLAVVLTAAIPGLQYPPWQASRETRPHLEAAWQFVGRSATNCSPYGA